MNLAHPVQIPWLPSSIEGSLLHGDVRSRLRQLVDFCIVPFMVAAVATAIVGLLVFIIIPLTSSSYHRPWTASEMAAVAAKRAAQSDYGMSSVGDGGNEGNLLFDSPPAGVSFGGYSSRAGTIDRTDPVNIMFHGAASMFDIVWDMSQSPYTNGFGGSLYPPESGDSGSTGPWFSLPYGGVPIVGNGECNLGEQDLNINGEFWPSNQEVVSRQSGHCVPPYVNADVSRFHMRLWGGAVSGLPDTIAVGTAHWDPDENHKCGSYNFEQAEMAVVQTFQSASGLPAWYVADIWEFPVIDDGSTTVRTPAQRQLDGDLLGAQFCFDNAHVPMNVQRDGSGNPVIVNGSVVPLVMSPPSPSGGCGTGLSSSALNTLPGGDGWGAARPDGCAHYIDLIG